ncbi:MAG: hypothetical protein R3266_04615 [Gemmatimonadota bacterium]|nr:hypothetical protein [Gemmatimonadota bacterium]
MDTKHAEDPRATCRRRRSGAWLALALLAGCSQDRPTYEAVADVKDLMLSVLEPSAEVYWDAVGEILDKDGVHEIRPASNEEWEAVRNAAFVIAESGNLLMMAGRARDRGPWVDYSREMIESGRLALRAAEARDDEAVFDAGAEVYYACTNCHAAYAQEKTPEKAMADLKSQLEQIEQSA